MVRRRCTITRHERVAPGHYVLSMRSPEIAKSARPGQFVQVLCGDSCDPLLPRPFSFLTATKSEFSFLYHVVGRGTQALSQLRKGESLWVVGPLGHGFAKTRKKALLVGGGVGIPPLYHLAQSLKRKKDAVVFLGARNRSLLLCESDFKRLGVEVRSSTDDGSKGHKGFVTSLLESFLKKVSAEDVQIFTCGPTPMLKAVSALANKYGVECEVSVEVPMACGFGACLGCAIKVGDRFAIACKEGPVFQGKDIRWE